jgi:hypothetical protein
MDRSIVASWQGILQNKMSCLLTLKLENQLKTW